MVHAFCSKPTEHGSSFFFFFFFVFFLCEGACVADTRWYTPQRRASRTSARQSSVTPTEASAASSIRRVGNARRVAGEGIRASRQSTGILVPYASFGKTTVVVGHLAPGVGAWRPRNPRRVRCALGQRRQGACVFSEVTRWTRPSLIDQVSPRGPRATSTAHELPTFVCRSAVRAGVDVGRRWNRRTRAGGRRQAPGPTWSGRARICNWMRPER